jgi:predicted ATPase
MLEQFRVQNFKAFQDTSSIVLAPVTLLAGINSAGKSSLIQALLLLKQTLESKPSQALNPGPGPLLEQGLGDNFDDLVFGRPKLEKAELAFHMMFAYDSSTEVELYEALNTLTTDLNVKDLPSGRLSSKVDVTFGWGSYGYRGRPTIRVTDLQIQNLIAGEPLIGLQLYPARSGGMYSVDPKREQTHPTLQTLNFTQLEVDGLSNFLPDSLILSRERLPLGKDIPPSFARLFRSLFAAVRRDLSEQIHYLNSFRDPPAPFYPSGQAVEAALTPRGSNFPAVLWRYRDEKVRFAAHPSQGVKTKSLQDMVAFVLADTLQLKQRVQVRQVGSREDILEVKVSTLGSEPIQVTLADVGLGYNQVLPIVVQGLLTEIHLHADVQARLINFFIGLARSGRQVLVETHSSHMVDHLCLEIVKDRTNWLAKNAQVLFVHPPDEQHSSAQIEPVKIDPYGKIINYPPHFLPDTAALYEEIIKEGFAKRREEKKPKEPLT